jgi:hypothetical protein
MVAELLTEPRVGVRTRRVDLAEVREETGRNVRAGRIHSRPRHARGIGVSPAATKSLQSGKGNARPTPT